MLAKRRALIQEGQMLVLAGEQIWANYSQQKMSDTKKEIQQGGTNARTVNKEINNNRQNL